MFTQEGWKKYVKEKRKDLRRMMKDLGYKVTFHKDDYAFKTIWRR